jgi:hypothetical protein
MKLLLSTLAITAVAAGLAGCGGTTVEPDAGQLAQEGGLGGSVGTGGRSGLGGSTGTGGSAGTAGNGGTITIEAGPDAKSCGVIRASDYDQSCTTATDCTSVFEGDTCASRCGCPNATISQKALDGYHPLFPGGMLACPCAMIGVPSCIGGVCTMCPLAGCPARDGG